MLHHGTPVHRGRIPPFRRRDLPGIYLAVLVFGLVVPFLPASPTAAPISLPISLPIPAPIPLPALVPPAPPPPPVQVEVVAAGKVVARTEIVNRIADSHVVALTFDDGPDPRWTPQVLAVLKRHGAVATFCMIEHNAAANPGLVKQVVDGGNRLCDHSRSHDEQLPERPPDKIHDEVVGAEVALSDVAGGASVDWFRAPGGNWSDDLTKLSVVNGMQPLGWNIDPKDWERPGVEAIVTGVQQQLREQAPDGGVILLHDGGGPRDETVAALEPLITWLATHGYRFGFPVP